MADYAALTQERGPGDAKVMIDLLSRRTADLVAALRAGACDVVGIHPDQPGSLSRVLQHAGLAAGFGVPVVIGGTGYTGVGSAAYQHVAGVVGGPVGELGEYFDHGMPHNLVRESLPMRDGCVELPDRSGLGTELDEEILARYCQGFREWRKCDENG